MSENTLVDIVVWLILVPLAAIAIAVWIYRFPDRGAFPQALRNAYSRIWGEYRRIRRGAFLEGGEHETCRMELVGVTAYSVDRHVSILRRCTCIVTSRRMVMCDLHGSRIELLGSDIRAVRARRTYHPVDGFSYSVVLERAGSPIHDPEGDMLLVATGQQHSEALSAALDDLCVTHRPAAIPTDIHS